VVCIWNFHTMFYCVLAHLKPNFNPIVHSDGKLWIVKVRKMNMFEDPFHKSGHIWHAYICSLQVAKYLIPVSMGLDQSGNGKPHL